MEREDSKFNPEIAEKIHQLEEKYGVAGQDLSSHLEGLLYADYLNYWDYIHLDTLLSLQNPKTTVPDERIFIGYHQITELYLKLILWEMEQLSHLEEPDEEIFLMKLKRLNRYFEHLANSFDIMSDGMAQEQFLKFRKALFPASGFQSAQIRYVEFASSPVFNLVAEEFRKDMKPNMPLNILYDRIYWKMGAVEKSTGKKTLTLLQFEEKYDLLFKAFALDYEDKNIAVLYNNYYQNGKLGKEIKHNLKVYDQLVNVHWRLAHFKSAVKYLHRNPNDLEASGGTNWQKYLPPRFQKISFFPELWSEKELADWGKPWVEKEVFKHVS